MKKRNQLQLFILLAVIAFLSFESAAQTSPTYQFSQNEILAFRSVRTLHGAEATYQSTYGNGNYGTLSQLGDAQLIDAALASGLKYNYVFQVVTVPVAPMMPAEVYITATPRKYRVYGRYSFFIDTSGVMHGADKNGQPATANDPVIDDSSYSCSASSNEGCVVQDFRTLHGAEATYQATYGNGHYTGLTELRRVNLIGAGLASGILHGYSISIVIFPPVTGQQPAQFRIIALPQTYGVTGVRSFFIGTDGVIHGADRQGRPADENDPPINE